MWTLTPKPVHSICMQVPPQRGHQLPQNGAQPWCALSPLAKSHRRRLCGIRYPWSRSFACGWLCSFGSLDEQRSCCALGLGAGYCMQPVPGQLKHLLQTVCAPLQPSYETEMLGEAALRLAQEVAPEAGRPCAFCRKSAALLWIQKATQKQGASCPEEATSQEGTIAREQALDSSTGDCRALPDAPELRGSRPISRHEASETSTGLSISANRSPSDLLGAGESSGPPPASASSPDINVAGHDSVSPSTAASSAGAMGPGFLDSLASMGPQRLDQPLALALDKAQPRFVSRVVVPQQGVFSGLPAASKKEAEFRAAFAALSAIIGAGKDPPFHALLMGVYKSSRACLQQTASTQESESWLR